MYRQKGEAVKFLFPAGQGGYEVVWKGAKSDTTTSKQALGVIRARNDMDSLGKQRQCYPGPDTQTFRHTARTIIFSLYIAIMKNWHMNNPISFSFVFPHTKSPTYSEKCPMVCRHQIFNPPSPRFSQKSHYLCHPNKQ